MAAYPDSKNVASFSDLRRHYDALKEELEASQSAVKQERWGHSQAAKSKRQSQAELKKSKGTTAALQKQVSAQERARQDSNRAGAWRASAATAVTIFYEICRTQNMWPGGYSWAPVWEHTATSSCLGALICWILSQAYAATQDV